MIAFYDIKTGEQMTWVDGRMVRWRFGALWRPGEDMMRPRDEDVRELVALGPRAPFVK